MRIPGFGLRPPNQPARTTHQLPRQRPVVARERRISQDNGKRSPAMARLRGQRASSRDKGPLSPDDDVSRGMTPQILETAAHLRGRRAISPDHGVSPETAEQNLQTTANLCGQRPNSRENVASSPDNGASPETAAQRGQRWSISRDDDTKSPDNGPSLRTRPRPDGPPAVPAQRAAGRLLPFQGGGSERALIERFRTRTGERISAQTRVVG